MSSALFKGQRWQVSSNGRRASLSKRWMRAALLAVAGVWNVAAGVAFALFDVGFPVPPLVGVLACVAGVCLLGYALHELLFRTQYRFEAGYFVCTTGPLAFRRALELPLSEIEGFITARTFVRGAIHVKLRNGEVPQVPTPLDDERWILTNAAFAPYTFLKGWLNDACNRAQHEGGGYRIAPGQQSIHQRDPGEGSDLHVDRTQKRTF